MKTNFLSKYSFAFCLFFAIAQQAFSQTQKTYLGYYSLINQAEMLTFEKKHEQALSKYMEAFKYANGFETDYSEAIKIALNLKKYDLTLFFLKERALKTGGYTPEELYDSLQFATFLNTKFGKEFENKYEKWLVINQKMYDFYVLGLVRSIDATDQFVRSGYLRKYKESFINDSLYQFTKYAILEEVDNTNFLRFKNFVKNIGFPGRSKLGGKTSFTNTFIVHVFKFNKIYSKTASTFETERFYFLDSLLKKQILIGEFENERFAYCYDYSFSNDSITYYAYPRYDFDVNGKLVYANYPVIDPQNLNKRRAEIGLMSIEDQCKIYGVPLPPNYKSN